MNTKFFTALGLTAAIVSIAPAAKALELQPTLQEQRFSVLDRIGSKAIEDIHETRLYELDNRIKVVDDIHETRLYELDNRVKVVDDIHETRLYELDNRIKANGDRLAHLNNQTVEKFNHL